MTLLEATIAFILLSIAGVVCLEQSRAATQLQTANAEWTRAVAQGEAALQSATLPDAPFSESTAKDADHIRVARRPWRGRVDVVEVTVPLSHGGAYTTRRLVERPQPNVNGRPSDSRP